MTHCIKGFPGGSDSKKSACNAGDLGSILGLGRSPGEGNGFLFYTVLNIIFHLQSLQNIGYIPCVV